MPNRIIHAETSAVELADDKRFTAFLTLHPEGEPLRSGEFVLCRWEQLWTYLSRAPGVSLDQPETRPDVARCEVATVHGVHQGQDGKRLQHVVLRVTDDLTDSAHFVGMTRFAAEARFDALVEENTDLAAALHFDSVMKLA